MLERLALKQKAQTIWSSYRRNRCLTQADKDTLRAAYYDGVLPKDPDYSVAEWVEKAFPKIFF